MAYEDIKNWLNQGRTLQKEIDLCKLEYENALAMATSMTAVYNQTGKVSSSHGRNDEKFISFSENKYVQMLSENIEKRQRILYDISRVIYSVNDGQLRLLLINRYIIGATWETTAVNMNITFRWAHVLHERALRVVKKIIDENKL